MTIAASDDEHHQHLLNEHPVDEEPLRFDPWRRSRRQQARRKAKERKHKMDMSKYAGSSFIKVDDLVGGPVQKVIASIEEGRYEKPVVTFEDGSKLSLNGTNVGTLIRAFGKNAEDWIGQRIEIYAGTLRYNGNDNPAVLVRALDVLPTAARTPPKPQPPRDDLDDAIPF
jgi:hypothetical protein